MTWPMRSARWPRLSTRLEFGEFASKRFPIPLWVMIIGAFGISFGLFLFGPRLIRMVGRQITKLNPIRAFCIALSAAITVILASWLGLPVSSTHIAVGAVFGVGFYREWDSERRRKQGKFQRTGTTPCPGRIPPSQAGTAVAFHDHRGCMDCHRARRRNHVGRHLLGTDRIRLRDERQSLICSGDNG